MTLHKDHRKRLRARYTSEGLGEFADHMILELLLFETIPRVDTNPIGHRLLDRFGTLDGVLRASEEELCAVEGIGAVTAKMLREVSDHMLFRILAGCDFSAENQRFSLAAEYHMRGFADGVASVFSEHHVFDYASDGGADGLWEAVQEDLAVYGIEDYAVVIKGDTVTAEMREELTECGFPHVFLLGEDELKRIE